ncbi:MAG: leucine-rich repeat protein [Stecheria intestinalis]|nr:leucine-rich repeat protein [Stecheria intestinalis]
MALIVKTGWLSPIDWQILNAVDLEYTGEIDLTGWNCGEIFPLLFSGSKFKKIILPEGITSFAAKEASFSGAAYLFEVCENLEEIIFPSSYVAPGTYLILACSKLKTVTFRATSMSLSKTTFIMCDALTDIYVPWAEGAVAGAPWGATNATVHYNSAV